jgi:hypothetical protein
VNTGPVIDILVTRTVALPIGVLETKESLPLLVT